MPEIDKFEAIRRFNEIIRFLKEHESTGLDIEDVEELTVIDYKSQGYSKPAKVRKAKKAHFEELDFKAPEDIKAIIPFYEEIVKQLEANKPKHSIRAIIKKLAPYGSWATLAYSILHNRGLI